MATSILPTSLDYTDKDFAALRARLVALVRSVFPQWTDFNVANFGNLLLELFAFVGDMLGFYQDNQAREARLATATQRKNVIALAKMLGYLPQGAQAAQATELLTLAAPPLAQVTIPAGTIILTANVTTPVSFQLLADAVFAPRQTSWTGLVENSASIVDTFASNGLPNQAFVLSATPYLDGATTITCDDGTYTEVDNFLASGSTSRNFTVSVDQNDKATVVFGDSVNGAIPRGTIAVHYKTGGGSAGNVDPGTINRVQGTFTDALGNPVTLSATNPEKAQGGLERQSSAQIQTLAPLSVRVNERSVTKEDFEINAGRVPGVARALLNTSNEDPGIAENSGILYVVPVGGGPASSSLLSAVTTMVTMTYPSLLTFRLSTQTALYLPINVLLRVYRAKGILPAQVALNLRATLASYFAIQNPDGTANENIDFGSNFLDANGSASPLFALAPLFTACEQTAGVRKLGGQPGDFLLNGAHQDVVLLGRQFPTLGTVAIIDGDTGATL